VTILTALRGSVVLVAALLSVAANVPYVAAVRRRDPDARPRLASWVIWSAALGVGTASAGMAGAWNSVAYTGACAAGCFAVVAYGWRYGSREFGRLDAICATVGAAGVAALALAAVLPQMMPAWGATTAAVLCDSIAFLPTYRNGWRGQEPWLPYAMYALGAALDLAAADFGRPADMIYPTYLVAADLLMTLTVLVAKTSRRGRTAAGHTLVLEVGSVRGLELVRDRLPALLPVTAATTPRPVSPPAARSTVGVRGRVLDGSIVVRGLDVVRGLEAVRGLDRDGYLRSEEARVAGG
jgi:hypothetical protein